MGKKEMLGWLDEKIEMVTETVRYMKEFAPPGASDKYNKRNLEPLQAIRRFIVERGEWEKKAILKKEEI
jgi:hypothetical protein